MADAPSSSSYTLVSPDSVDLPNSRTILADGVGIRLNDTGNAGTLTITTQGNLGHLSSFNTAGYLSYNTTTQNFVGRSFSGGGTISITNPDGVGGNTSLTVIPETTIQLINTQYNTTDPIVTRPTLNFVPGNNVQIDISDNVSNNSADIRVSTTGIEPVSQNLIDIAGLTPLSGSLIIGTGSHYAQLNLGPAGTVLKSNGTTGVWADVPGTGTVTSITAGANLTGGTITTTGTIALSPILTGLTSVQVGNLSLATNTITSTENHSVVIQPDGSGNVLLSTLGGGNIILGASEDGNISLSATGGPISLTTNDGNIELETTGTGDLILNAIGSGDVALTTAGIGGVYLKATGSGPILIESHDTGSIGLSTIGNGDVTIFSSGDGSISLETEDTGSVSLSATNGPISLETLGDQDISLSTKGIGNVELTALDDGSVTLEAIGGGSVSAVANDGYILLLTNGNGNVFLSANGAGDILLLPTFGKVGIKTDIPEADLDVNGTSLFEGIVTYGPFAGFVDNVKNLTL